MARPRAKTRDDRICRTLVPELRPMPSVYCHHKCDPSDYAACSESPAGFADQSPLQWLKGQDRTMVVFSTLQVYLGSQYVNDFNYLGRTYQVRVQGDGGFRGTPQDITRLKARNASGNMVP